MFLFKQRVYPLDMQFIIIDFQTEEFLQLFFIDQDDCLIIFYIFYFPAPCLLLIQSIHRQTS